MTLKANCATTKKIEIPDGFMLDGGNKTIKLAGSAPVGIVNANGAEAVNTTT